jgi:uncharacterized membrane protein YagU involved in acid resistance
MRDVNYDENPLSEKSVDRPAMTEYRFVTFWHIEAPLHDVYEAVYQSLRWPEWWRGAERVEQLSSGDADGIGSVLRYTWKSRLPYRLVFDACTIRIEPLAALEATTSGDLEGSGRWIFSHERNITTVRYEWQVHTTPRWMNLLAPAARSVFAKNHHALMQRGAEGLARLLDARLVDVTHMALPATAGSSQRNVRRPINWTAGVIGGIGAGIIATVVQVALWRACDFPLPEIFFRDARLAAAIVMGRTVLPPPATFDWTVMLAATIVHFALSIVYGLLLAPLLARLEPRRALFAGAAFGLLLYGTNMYGFTLIFPWFEASRDWITATAHASFGMAAAWLYATWDKD